MSDIEGTDFSLIEEEEYYGEEKEGLECEDEQRTLSENTLRSTRWGLHVWKLWAEKKNASRADSSIPIIPVDDDILKLSDLELGNYLAEFVVELRKPNGGKYPSESVTCILFGINRFLKIVKGRKVDIFDKWDSNFQIFMEMYENEIKALKEEGLSPQKQSHMITAEHERILWDKGIMNMTTAVGLQRAVFFYICKTFGLSSRMELRKLCAENFTFGSNEHGRYVQLERPSVPHLVHAKLYPKVMTHYEVPENVRCVYNIIFTYLNYIPKKGPFFRQPSVPCLRSLTEAKGHPIHIPIEFSHSHVGGNSLTQIVKNMMAEAGIKGHYTNQSVKMTYSYFRATMKKRFDGVDNSGYSMANHSQVKQLYTLLEPPPPQDKEPVVIMSLNPPPFKKQCIRVENAAATAFTPQATSSFSTREETVVRTHQSSNIVPNIAAGSVINQRRSYTATSAQPTVQSIPTISAVSSLVPTTSPIVKVNNSQGPTPVLLLQRWPSSQQSFPLTNVQLEKEWPSAGAVVTEEMPYMAEEVSPTMVKKEILEVDVEYGLAPEKNFTESHHQASHSRDRILVDSVPDRAEKNVPTATLLSSSAQSSKDPETPDISSTSTSSNTKTLCTTINFDPSNSHSCRLTIGEILPSGREQQFMRMNTNDCDIPLSSFLPVDKDIKLKDAVISLKLDKTSGLFKFDLKYSVK